MAWKNQHLYGPFMSSGGSSFDSSLGWHLIRAGEICMEAKKTLTMKVHENILYHKLCRRG